jgi:rRNA-processing protein FCF1
MKTIIADTNFLIDCANYKIDIHSELSRILDENFEVAILDRTLDELENLQHEKGKKGASAKLVKTILMTKPFVTIMTTGGHVDKLLLRQARPDVIIATADREIKKKLKDKKLPVIVVRQKNKLAIGG